MMGLAQIYKKYCLQAEAGKEASKQISWIKDKLLHIYYQNSIDDKYVITFRPKCKADNWELVLLQIYNIVLILL